MPVTITAATAAAAAAMETDTFLQMTDGENTTVYKISNDLAKKKLIDGDEEDVSALVEKHLTTRRKSSLSGWEDARRLSEAGVRRASDSSVVLTEDTDSFIIGDRVWVGGTKPGQIAYIGETQFAPGDWAGIVLDEPIGKNDGSVAGIRYFQCENRKGIFSRLTRLTSTPLASPDGGCETTHFTSPTNGSGSPTSVSSSHTLLSPTNSTRSFNTSASHASRTGTELKVGDRVIVMSSQGSKAGMLRYLGTTQFAQGEWCGVELDEPLGKNDGSVAGVRYFECAAKFGLFAPISKVSLSPTSSRRPSCALHHTPMKKQGSHESLNSVASTAASSIKSAARKPPSRNLVSTPTATSRTPMQDVLKEKEIYIEQLLKERDLERAEVTRAASQADDAERKLDSLRQEFLQFREETEAKSIDMQALVIRLQEEKDNLMSLLEDERKRSEEMQFRFEEESFSKTDIEARNEKNEERIKELEQMLADEQNRAELLELESNKLFEVDEALTKLRITQETNAEFIEKLKNQIEIEQKCNAQLKGELELTNNKLEKFTAVANERNEELMKLTLSVEENKTLTEDRIKKVIKGYMTEIDKLKINVQELENKNKDSEVKITILNTELEDTKNSSERGIVELKEKHSGEINLLQKQFEETERNLKASEANVTDLLAQLQENKNIIAAENQITTKQAEDTSKFMKELEEGTAKKDVEIINLKNTITTLNKSLQEMSEEFSNFKVSSNTVELNLEKELEELKLTLKHTADDFKIKENKLNEEVSYLKKTLEENKQCLLESEEKSKNVESLTQTKFEELKEKIKCKEEELKNIVADNGIKSVTYDKELKALVEDVKVKNEQCNQMKSEIEELKAEVGEQLNSIQNLQKQLAESQKAYATQQETLTGRNQEILKLQESNENTNKQMANMMLEIGEWKRKFEGTEEKYSLLSQQKFKLEADLSELMNSSSDSSDQLSKLNNKLRAKENELTSAVEKAGEQAREAESKYQRLQQELTEKLDKAKADKENIQRQFNDELKIKDDECRTIKNNLEQAEVNKQQLLTKLDDATKAANEVNAKFKLLEEKQLHLQNKYEETLQEKENLFKSSDLSKEESNKLQLDLKERIKCLESECETLKTNVNGLKEKEIQFQKQLQESEVQGIEKNKDFEKIIFEKDIFILELKGKITALTEDVNKLQMKQGEVNNDMTNKETEILTLKEEIVKIKSDKLEADEKLSTSEAKLVGVTQELEKAQNSVLMSQHKSNELELKLNDEIKKLEQEKELLQKEIKDKEHISKDIQNELDKLKAEINMSSLSLSERDSKLVEVSKTFEKMCLEKNAQLAEANEKLLMLEKENQLSLERIVEISQKKVDLEHKLLNFEKETSSAYTNLQGEKAKLEIQLRESKKEYETLNNQYKTLTLKASKLIQQQSDVEKKFEHEAESLKKELKESKMECDKIRKESETVKDSALEVANLKEQLKESFTKHEKQHVILQDSKEEAELLRQRLKDIEAERDKLRKQIDEELHQVSKQMNEMRQKLNNSESERDNLQKQLDILKHSLQASPENKNTVNNGNVSEDTELEKAQINFLNSIIVDMQRKNDELKARIHYLETGDLPGATNMNGQKHIVAPRLFCDICDMFDMHDTEDCPRQAMDSPPPQQIHKPMPRGYQRPYCDICEVFGHDTAECEDDRTF